jgi:hypothetical protein
MERVRVKLQEGLTYFPDEYGKPYPTIEFETNLSQYVKNRIKQGTLLIVTKGE